jgi:hypothetical protein
MLPPSAAWQRLLLVQDVLAEQPAIARAVRTLSLLDQLSLTLELLGETDWPDSDTAETLPPNVLRFRARPRDR